MKNIPKIEISQKPTYLKIAEGVNFFELFKKIERRYDTCFMFESLGEDGKFSRYSIIGFEPVNKISARGNILTMDGKKYPVTNPYYALRNLMPEATMSREYAGGLVGYLSYEALNYMEPSLNIKTHKKFEQFMLGFYTDGLIHDKLTDELLYFYYGTDRSEQLKELIKSRVTEGSFRAKCVGEGLTEKEHARIVEDVKEKIRDGKTFQCEVGFKTEYEIEGDTVKIYEKLRKINPSPFMYYLKFGKKKVMDIEMSFLHDGRPIEIQKSKRVIHAHKELPASARDNNLREALLQILSRPNIGSMSFISEQYDHEVQGTSVTKPLQGKGRVNADSAVLQPLPDSSRGIVLAHGYCPWYSGIDTYAMAAASIDTVIRNAVCAGASRDYLAILDNFCWSSSNTPERLYELKEAARACFDVATAYGTPFISGKDSMFNDFRGFTENGKNIQISAQPTLLISALGVIPDVSKAMTIDFKQAGDFIYLIGETNNELGASEYFAMLGDNVGKTAPVVDTKKNAKAYDALSRAISGKRHPYKLENVRMSGCVASAISVGRGGLAAAIAKSAVAGQLGASINLKNVPGDAKQDDSILFSESQGRMLVSVRPDAKSAFEKIYQGLTLVEIGKVVGESVSIELPKTRVEASVAELTNAYRSFFSSWGGSAFGGKNR